VILTEPLHRRRRLPAQLRVVEWADLLRTPVRQGHRVIDTDMVAILYTSGQHGQAQGRGAVASQHGGGWQERRQLPAEPAATTRCWPPCR
jgi:hypothetical protein